VLTAPCAEIAASHVPGAHQTCTRCYARGTHPQHHAPLILRIAIQHVVARVQAQAPQGGQRAQQRQNRGPAPGGSPHHRGAAAQRHVRQRRKRRLQRLCVPVDAQPQVQAREGRQRGERGPDTGGEASIVAAHAEGGEGREAGQGCKVGGENPQTPQRQ
jgi:hypothetical protein